MLLHEVSKAMSFHECPVPTLVAQHVDEVGFEEDEPRHPVGMIEGQPHGDRSPERVTHQGNITLAAVQKGSDQVTLDGKGLSSISRPGAVWP